MTTEAPPFSGAEQLNAFIGHRIAALSTALSLTPAVLAAKSGISLEELDGYIAGEGRVEPAELLKLADIFGVPIAAFFDGFKQRIP